jgi:hypothetical protein
VFTLYSVYLKGKQKQFLKRTSFLYINSDAEYSQKQ